MKWGVTGARGQLGRELCDVLRAHGQIIHGWGRSELDITQTASIDIVLKLRPDILVNCAAWTDVEGAEDNVEESFAVNHVGAGHMARAAGELQIPFVHISTDYVFSGTSKTPWSTTDAANPASVYGRSKLAGEREVQSIYPDKSYIVRTAWLYSKFGSNFPKKIIKNLLVTNDVFTVVDDQIGQPTSALDLSRQIIEMVQSNLSPGVFHATNGGEASWFDFSQRILTLMDEPKERILRISSQNYPSKVMRPSYSVLENKNWLHTSVVPMRQWITALDEVFPTIVEEVRKELDNG